MESPCPDIDDSAEVCISSSIHRLPHHAVKKGHLDCLKAILAKHPKLINSEDNGICGLGFTPIQLASQRGFEDIFNWLLDNGADPMGADPNMITKYIIGVLK